LDIENLPNKLLPSFTKLPQKPLFSVGIKDYIKMVAIPLDSNKLQIRLENLYDRYDKTKMNKTDCYINELDLITSIWKLSNQAKASNLTYTLLELSLSGNMPIKEMKER